MRRTWPVVLVLAAAGCGGTVGATHEHPSVAGEPTLSADGISVALPDSWDGRIVIGESGRPVLHASTLPLEANDTDEGQLAQEALGVNGMYLNVRDLGPGDAQASLPLRFGDTDFEPVPPGDNVCCHVEKASSEIVSEGERFRVVAVSGGDSPDPQYLDQLNRALSSLTLSAYRPQPVAAADGDAIDGFGLHANVPSGWEGGIARGEVHAGDGSLDLSIQEYSSPEASSFVTGRVPILLGPAEFVRPQGGSGYETGRTFTDAGREFQLWVRSPTGDPPTGELERANAFLASFRAQPGDFYPGQVDPATFEAADGWDTGSTGPADIRPEGQQTQSWASTIPYRDSGFQFPPSETLDALPPDGVVMTVRLDQEGTTGLTPVQPPFRVADFQEGSFEGVSLDNAMRNFGGHAGNYDLTITLLFGRAHPTQEQLDRAQAELDRLQLPDWPAWTATSAGP